MDVSANDVRRWERVEELSAKVQKSSTAADVDSLRAEFLALATTEPGRICIKQGLGKNFESKKLAVRELVNALAELAEPEVPFAEQRLLLAAATQAVKWKPQKDAAFWLVQWLRIERGDTTAGTETAKTVEKLVKERKEAPERALDGVEALMKVASARRLALFERTIEAGLNGEARKAVDAQLVALRGAPTMGTKPQPKPPEPLLAKPEPAKLAEPPPTSKSEPPTPATEPPAPPPEPPALSLEPAATKPEPLVKPGEAPAKTEVPTAPEEKPPPARAKQKERETGSGRKGPVPEADNREEDSPVRLPWPFAGRKPPVPPAPPAPNWNEAAAPLLALLGKMDEKVDALFRRAVAEDERSLAAEAERGRRAGDHAAELEKARAEVEAAERERDRLAGELDDSREALKRERARADDLSRALADATRKAEAAERDAEQVLHDAELARQSGVDSFRAKLGETLRRHLVDLPDAVPASAPPGEQILLNRLVAIRRALRESAIKLD